MGEAPKEARVIAREPKPGNAQCPTGSLPEDQKPGNTRHRSKGESNQWVRLQRRRVVARGPKPGNTQSVGQDSNEESRVIARRPKPGNA